MRTCCDTSEGITTLPKVMAKSRQYACMIHAGKRARIRHQRIGSSMANRFGYRHTHAQESILATLVPCGLEPVVLSKSKATGPMQGGVEALMGHGVEDVGGRVVWEHGEVIGMDADRVRVKYHSDKLKLWHRRFRMDYYGNLAKPVETTEVGGAGVAKLAYYSCEAGVLQLAAAG